MVILLFVGGVVASLCLFLSIRGIFGGRHMAVQATVVSSPLRSLVVGAGASLVVFGAFIGLQSSGVPLLRLVAVAVSALGVMAVLFGLSAVVGILGERVLALRNRDSSPFAQTAVGTLLLAVMGALPLLGWFLIAPVAALIGLGALLISTRKKGADGATAA